jgi:hypothetical protein
MIPALPTRIAGARRIAPPGSTMVTGVEKNPGDNAGIKSR